MALTILSNLSYNGKNPNFERDRVATVEDLKAVKPENQEYDYGHIVFCEEDGKHYRFMYKYGAPNYTNYNDTTGWFQEFAAEGTGSGGSIDTDNLATKEELNAKQDVITDLGSIRSGAAKGATAVQAVRINDNPITQPESGLITLELKYSDINDTPTFKTINGDSILGDGNIEITTEGGGIIAESDPIFKASAAAGITADDIEMWNSKSDFSGNYDDLSNKPTIPSAVTEDTVSRWGFTKNKGTVTSVKINGVAKSPDSRGEVDLGTVQSGSGDTYINGVTDVIVDGATVVSDNVAIIPNASTSDVGVVQLSNDVDSDSETKAATSAAVKSVNDKVNGKQDAISDIEEIRTNASNAFKGTINGETTGDLDVVTSVNGVNPNSGAVTIDVGDKNVRSDWNATSGDAFIKNKPTIPTTLSQLAQSASYRTVTDAEKNTWNAKLDKNTADNSYLGKNDKAASATNADNATNDGNGKNISNTYATKAALSGGLAGKQDVIDDLASIREKADSAFTGSINGTKDGSFMFADKVNINGNTKKANSEGTIELGDYATLDDLNSKVDKESGKGLSTNDFTTALKSKLDGIAPGAEVNVQSDWSEDDSNSDTYIKNKPTIPAAVTEDTVRDWGFTKNTGTYSKPDGGIPTTDLANDVQEKINKADKAFTGSINGSKNGGFFTVEKIVMNGNDYPREGSFTHIDLGTVLTEHQDLSDYLTTTTAANTYLKKTANAASATKATQDGNGKNIADTYATKSELANINAAYPLVNHGTSDKTFTLTPNVFHVWDNVDFLSLTLGAGTDGVANEYLFQFSCLSDQATTLGLPSGIQWANGEAPTLEVLKTYQVSILNNCATYVSFG